MVRRIAWLVMFSGICVINMSLQAARAERYERYVERIDARIAEAAPFIAAWQAKLADPFTGIAGYADLPGPAKALFTRAGIRSNTQRACLGQLIVLMNANAGEGFEDFAGWIAYFQQAITVGQLRACAATAALVANIVIDKHFPKFVPLIPFFQIIVPQLNGLLEGIEHFDDDAPVGVVLAPHDDDNGGYVGDFDEIQPESRFQYAMRTARGYKKTIIIVTGLALVAVIGCAGIVF